MCGRKASSSKSRPAVSRSLLSRRVLSAALFEILEAGRVGIIWFGLSPTRGQNAACNDTLVVLLDLSLRISLQFHRSPPKIEKKKTIEELIKESCLASHRCWQPDALIVANPQP